MEMSYGGAMVLPRNYVVMDQEEMTYLEGGGYLAVVGAILGIVGTSYTGAYALGQYLGNNYSDGWYKYNKETIKNALIYGCSFFGPLGKVAGWVVWIGVDNGWHSVQ